MDRKTRRLISDSGSIIKNELTPGSQRRCTFIELK